jgi:hypothetical protein
MPQGSAGSERRSEHMTNNQVVVVGGKSSLTLLMDAGWLTMYRQ